MAGTSGFTRNAMRAFSSSARGTLGQSPQFGFAFHVEEQNAGLQAQPASRRRSCPRRRRRLFSRRGGPLAGPVPALRRTPHRSRIPFLPAGEECPDWNSPSPNSRPCVELCGRRARRRPCAREWSMPNRRRAECRSAPPVVPGKRLRTAARPHRAAAKKSLADFAIGKGRRTALRSGLECGSLALGFAFHLDGDHGLVVECLFPAGMFGRLP